MRLKRKKVRGTLFARRVPRTSGIKTMFSVSNFELRHNEADVFYVESNDIVPPCPSCRGKLVYRDCKRRIVKNEGGTRKWLMIRRFRCSKCMKLHNELPSVVLPYKHYDGEVISGVLEKVVTPGDLDSEDCCCSHELLLTCSVLRHGRRKG